MNDVASADQKTHRDICKFLRAEQRVEQLLIAPEMERSVPVRFCLAAWYCGVAMNSHQRVSSGRWEGVTRKTHELMVVG